MKITAQALLFDVDGTLIDTNDVSDLVWGTWAKKHNIPFQAILDVHHGRKPEETIQLVAPHLNFHEEAADIYKEHLRITEGVRIIKGSPEIFNSLPLLRVGVVTSGTRLIVESRFRLMGLRTDCLMITAEVVTNGKPHPEPFLKAAEALKVAPHDCVVFEDSIAGIRAAKACGMKVIGLITTHKKEELHEADYLIHDYTEIKCEVTDSGIILHLL